jgi:hypothetical protein
MLRPWLTCHPPPPYIHTCLALAHIQTSTPLLTNPQTQPRHSLTPHPAATAPCPRLPRLAPGASTQKHTPADQTTGVIMPSCLRPTPTRALPLEHFRSSSLLLSNPRGAGGGERQAAPGQATASRPCDSGPQGHTAALCRTQQVTANVHTITAVSQTDCAAAGTTSTCAPRLRLTTMSNNFNP